MHGLILWIQDMIIINYKTFAGHNEAEINKKALRNARMLSKPLRLCSD